MGFLLSLQQPYRVGGERRDQDRAVPAGTGGADGRRRLQQDERPAQVRRRHHAGRPRLGELPRRHRPSLFGQHTHPVPGGRPGVGAVRGETQLLAGAVVPVGVEARRGHHRAGAGGGGDAAGLPQPAQRAGRAGDSGNPRRCRRAGSPRIGPGLPATEAAAPVSLRAATWPTRPGCC